MVRNSLIINQIIDQTILIDDRRDAIAIMDDNKLLNVKQCLTPNNDPGTGLRLAYAYGGGLTQSYQQAWRGNPRMHLDKDSYIRFV